MVARKVRMRRLLADPFEERRAALSAATPYLGLVRAPSFPQEMPAEKDLIVATYNLHRWTPPSRRQPEPDRGAFVIS